MNVVDVRNGFFRWSCPGCGHDHVLRTSDDPLVMCWPSTGAKWTWNGDMVKPTLSPSVNLPGYCHFFMHDGQLQFCGDSAHALKGQTVPMVPIEEAP